MSVYGSFLHGKLLHGRKTGENSVENKDIV